MTRNSCKTCKHWEMDVDNEDYPGEYGICWHLGWMKNTQQADLVRGWLSTSVDDLCEYWEAK